MTARVITTDGRAVDVGSSAWVLVAPPRFAPELTNLVTLYDTVYDMAVRNLGIRPDIFADGLWQHDHRPDWDGDIKPILERAHHYRWVVAIPSHPHDPGRTAGRDPPGGRASAAASPGRLGGSSAGPGIRPSWASPRRGQRRTWPGATPSPLHWAAAGSSNGTASTPACSMRHEPRARRCSTRYACPPYSGKPPAGG